MKNINKKAFLEAINGGLKFYQFIIEDLEKIDEKKCKPCLNPLYDDTKPALSIYFDDDKKKWLYYDHGTSPSGERYSGDVFDFAAKYYELDSKKDFREILKRIANDLHIKLEIIETDTISNALFDEPMDYYTGLPENYLAWLKGFQLFYREDGYESAYHYFKKYGITIEILKQYNVRAIDFYKTSDKSGKIDTKFISKRRLTIAYEDMRFAKLYSPQPKGFWYVGTKPKDYIFGVEQIYRRRRKLKVYQNTLFITGGEKDVLTLASLGYDAVCFNSETASVPNEAMENLFPIYQKIIILYDNDDTGLKKAEAIVNSLKEKFNISTYHLPEELLKKGGKDISDYVEKGMDVEQLKNDFSDFICNKEYFESDDRNMSEINVIDQTKKLTEYTPFLPSTVYNNLPELLKIICEQFIDPRDKDLVCLSAITVLSSFFPKVKGLYDRTDVGCNLYLFVSAPASAGKGVMIWARKLGNKIQKHLQEKYNNELVRYQAELVVYELNKRSNPDMVKPIPPQQQTMFIPANCSVSKMIQFLGANQNFGIIFETEGDALTNTLNNEWGDFSYVLRQAFHHETVTMARRKDDEFIEIDNPHLSTILSGTFNQACSLLKSVENGFFSRFVYYEFQPEMKWKNQFGIKENSLEEPFQVLSEIMLKYWLLQKPFPETKVYMNHTQISSINSYFENKLKNFYSEYGDPIAANVKRACLVFYRISMVFAILRWLEENNEMPTEMEICEADFKAAYGIVDTLLCHLQKVYYRIENVANTSRLNMKQKMLYEALPAEFTRSSYDSIAEGLKIKYKTAERYLGKFINNELIERYEQGMYRRA